MEEEKSLMKVRALVVPALAAEGRVCGHVIYGVAFGANVSELCLIYIFTYFKSKLCFS